MPVQIRRWLEVQGFERNPFEYYEADREELLSSYFFEPEWFEALRGDPREPASAVLFAPRGHGKTSQRLQIARLCGVEAPHPALVVQITDYKWLPSDLATLRASHYLRYIADRASQQIWERYSAEAGVRQRFAAQPATLLRLHAIRAWACAPAYRLRLPEPDFAPETLAMLVRRLRLPAPTDAQQLVDHMADHYDGLTDSDLQADLIELVRLAGFASLYVLIDRTDEDQQTAHHPEVVITRLAPLISDLPVIEHDGYAFKFFLPDVLQTLFVAHKIGRVGERPPSYPLSWRASDLQTMLARRLQSYSQLPGRISRAARVYSFQDLCVAGPDADALLVRAADGSPRRMIQLARELVEQHCAQIDDAETKITHALLEQSLPQPIAQLGLDAQGFVTFNGQRDEALRLTPLERKVLATLWQHRGRIVSKAELARVVYERQQADGNDIEALEKVIKRLRFSLAKAAQTAKAPGTYVAYVPRAGYHLVNVDQDNTHVD